MEYRPKLYKNFDRATLLSFYNSAICSFFKSDICQMYRKNKLLLPVHASACIFDVNDISRIVYYLENRGFDPFDRQILNTLTALYC